MVSWTPADYTETGDFSVTFWADDGTAHIERTVTISVAFIDLDIDGLPDSFEVANSLDPTTADSDGDNI